MSENSGAASTTSQSPAPLRSALKRSSSPRPISPESSTNIPDVLPYPLLYRSSLPSTASSVFTPGVSFDTFENPAASMFSFTLQVKSDGYKRTRNTRVFLCASSPDESGREALDWSLETLVQDGDELIVYRGIEQEELGTSIKVALSPRYANSMCREGSRHYS